MPTSACPGKTVEKRATRPFQKGIPATRRRVEAQLCESEPRDALRTGGIANRRLRTVSAPVESSTQAFGRHPHRWNRQSKASDGVGTGGIADPRLGTASAPVESPIQR